MPPKRVLLIRHGETEYNRQHIWQGMLDIPLNETGQAQAEALAKSLAETPLAAIYSSDLKRAFDTAQAVAKERDYAVIPDERLREMNLGIFQGLTREVITTAFADEYARWQQDDTFAPTDGESRIDLQERVLAGWQSIVEDGDFTGEETIALVAHGGSLRMLMRRLFPDGDPDAWHFENTSVTTLEWNDGWQIVTVADVTHLDGIDHADYDRGEASEV